MVNHFAAFLVLCLVIVTSAPAETTDWTQWRGPERTGLIESKADWPDKLSDDSLSKIWSVDLGPSYSTPIVKGNRVFTTETVDEQKEVVRALDRKTGEQLWEASWAGAMKVPFFAAANGSWIRATPAADEEHLYVAGIRDVLVCLKQATGEIVWKADFVEKLGSELPSFGFASSPLIAGDAIYVQAGGGFLKVDKASGEVLWRKLDDGGGMGGSAFSSPVMQKINGKNQLLVQTRTKLAGVAPSDGKVLWSEPIEAFRGMNILTPVLYKNNIFTSSYGGGTFLISASGEGDQWSAEQLWRNKLQGYMSSPILIGENIYMHQRNQRFASINLETGKENWITKPFGKYWSMVSNGKKILSLDSDGELILIEASPQEFKLLDRKKVSDSSTWAHLVVVGDEVYVRALDNLTAYQWK